jgi:capsid protein
MKRAAMYVIAKRAKQGVYDLPEDWWRIGFTKPAQFTVDEGRMRAADIADLRAGLTTEDHIVEARGMDYEELLRKRAANIVLKKQIAEDNGLNPTELGTTAMPGDPVELVEEETGENVQQLEETQTEEN